MENNLNGSGHRPESFYEKENRCDFLFKSGGPYWHLTTPGMFQEVLFISRDDYRFGMSSTAICIAECDIVVYAHTLMGNHVHDIVEGTRKECLHYMARRKERLYRYLVSQGRKTDLSAFECEPIPITDVRMLRNEIIYVHRNGYVVNPSHTPFSYPWGTGCYYFNPLANNDRGIPFSSLTYRQRRQVFHSRVFDLPDKYRFKDGMILPPSYCRVDKGEEFFRDAHQYFSLLSKNSEAYSEQARRIGDTVVLTDEEMYPAIQALSRRKYNVRRPSELDMKSKVEIARTMHEDYFASNSQIQRILNLDINAVNSLYPLKTVRK